MNSPRAFGDADSLLVLDIYPASETPIVGVSGELLARRIGEAGGAEAVYVASSAEAVTRAAGMAQAGDMILTLGAGNVSQLGRQVLEELDRRVVAAQQ